MVLNRLNGGGDRIRTCEGIDPADLQSASVGRLDTPPENCPKWRGGGGLPSLFFSSLSNCCFYGRFGGYGGSYYSGLD